MMLLAIIWVVLFLIWIFGGFYVVTDAGSGYRVHHSVILAILLGILGWITFSGFSALR